MVALVALTACHRASQFSGPVSLSSRVETFAVSIPQLSERQRTIRVYLPPSYDRPGVRFPVLYLQDGQQLFSPGPFGDWRVDETLDRLVTSGRLQGLIVVGIDNGPRRWDEYGPWTNEHMFDWVDSTWSRPAEGGEGDAYVDFVATTLKPAIDGRYHTLADRDHTGIGGSSMGGLIALHAGLTRPEVFSKVMAMSTAVWFAERGGPWLSDNRLLSRIRNGPVPRNVRWYLDVGGRERSRATDPNVVDSSGAPVSYARAYEEGTRAVAAALGAAGVGATDMRLVVDADAEHNETAWARRFEGAVSWLYQ